MHWEVFERVSALGDAFCLVQGIQSLSGINPRCRGNRHVVDTNANPTGKGGLSRSASNRLE